MIAIPAVDLRDGACVQLVGGSYADERIRLDQPVAVARRWIECGFRRLHVVDLDAATGNGSNAAVVTAILDHADVDVQVGGGVRSMDRVDDLLTSGARQVVVGTRAVEHPEWLADLAVVHPGQIIVAADVRGTQLVTHGWAQSQQLDVLDFLEEIDHLPLAGVLVTAVHREGQMVGPDLALMESLTDATHLPIIASGGIAGRGDLCALEHRGVAAAVIGMALYTGALDPHSTAEEFSE
ncbi:MAG: 1-(5-phosphoribosyl)-5-[(5-phosphoribosylamino)methylideneamino] imidazole-4-carboxamide isomerase [Gemmatimonadota bacterium]|nr:1-(5-phosphoribosyl)-5-[(5-phosphoribosylamino)methylideneamino] imidazole-4-carboxamide isomerase [Gemmatimonadota bacterium]HEU4988884.1 1-(5-phosphoribosyl)-5-[(5-phosphoribosylamino)methylideneamino] imidazole-4-carboxamide isomerase [Gemmatimonadaceae bacterium]